MFLLHRVFLTGKAHVDYRKVLNGRFTRKALGSVIMLIYCILFSWCDTWLWVDESRMVVVCGGMSTVSTSTLPIQR